MKKQRINKDGLDRFDKKRIITVLSMIDELIMAENDKSDTSLKRRVKEDLDFKVKEIKEYFEKRELICFNIKVGEFTKSKKNRIIKIIESRFWETNQELIKKKINQKTLADKITKKYEANKEIIFYYLYEQGSIKETLKLLNDTRVYPFKMIPHTRHMRGTDKFFKKMAIMKKENTQIRSIEKYLSIKLIFEYLSRDDEILRISEKNNLLSEMRVFFDVYFELIPQVASTITNFTVDRYDKVAQRSIKIQFSLIEDNTVDVIKLAYFYISDSLFRNDFIKEFSIKREELEEKEKEKEKKQKKKKKPAGRPTKTDPIKIFERIIQKRKECDKNKFTATYVNTFILKKEFGRSDGYLRSDRIKDYLSLVNELKDLHLSDWKNKINRKHLERMKEKRGELKN